MAAETQCEHCGWPVDQPYQTISRHRTSEGVVSYVRCACGVLRMLVTPYGFGFSRPVGSL